MLTAAQLFDVLTRHQIYLEGLKAGQAKKYNDILLKLDAELRRLFVQADFESLDQMTKRELNALLKRLENSQRRIYNAYSQMLISDIRKFMSVDADMNREFFETATDRRLQQAYEEGDGNPIIGLAPFLGTEEADARLWGSISNAPISANGVLLVPFISHFTSSASTAVQNAVRKGYANRWTKDQTLRAIVGTKAKHWRDGEFSKMYRQSSAVVSTALQHVAMTIQAGLSSIFYKRYVWNSVIDGGTTEICFSRNGKIYEFGSGPLPPAHIGCRSGIWPYSGNSDVDLIDVSYYSWLQSQPSNVQDDILGTSRAARLRKGELNSKDFPKFAEASEMSVDEFNAKRGIILTKG